MFAACSCSATGSLPVARADMLLPMRTWPKRLLAAAIQTFARTEGILLDPVCTGKTAAGLIAMVRDGAFEPDSNVLFIHTGGSPALYAYRDEALAQPDA